MTDTPQSSDIRTTRYTIKANVETTRYFVSPETDIEHQVNENTEDIAAIQAQLLLKENITDHDSDISAINSALNLKESKTDHNSDIQTINSALSNLSSRLLTDESNISSNTTNIAINNTKIVKLQTQMNSKESSTDHAADITNLQNQITSISNNSYEGYYRSIYAGMSGRCMIEYNYNKGRLMYAKINTVNWKASLNDVYGEYLDTTIKELILPANIKQISESGTITAYISDIKYAIDRTTDQYRVSMPNLTTITTEPNVKEINFVLTAAPNLRYFNLMEGLEALIIEGTMTSVIPNYPDSSKLINLRIPASVKTCSLKNALFGEVIFEGYTTREAGTELALTLNQCWICDKLYLVREVSSLSISNQSSVVAPRILETSFSLLKYMNNDSLGNRASEGLTFTTLILHEPNINSDSQSSMSNTLTFKRIFNYTYHNKNPYGYYTKLAADSWIE